MKLKHFILLVLVAVLSVSCKAQNPISLNGKTYSVKGNYILQGNRLIQAPVDSVTFVSKEKLNYTGYQVSCNSANTEFRHLYEKPSKGVDGITVWRLCVVKFDPSKQKWVYKYVSNGG